MFKPLSWATLSTLQPGSAPQHAHRHAAQEFTTPQVKEIIDVTRYSEHDQDPLQPLALII